MSAPTNRFSKLSLGGMTPTTRSRAQAQDQHSSDDDSSTDIDSDSDSSLEDETPAVIRSPSRLTYRIDNLPGDIQTRVRETFKDPPRLNMQYCRLRDGVYAFQMSELVPRSIRIGGPDSTFPLPRCSCGAAAPCKHVLWLLDQLTKQTLYGHDPGAPLTMKPEGHAEEVGEPYSSIASFHLDVAAEGLHCEVIRDASDSEDEAEDDDDQELARAREARELLAAVADQDPESYRPDIFAAPLPGKNIIKRRDLERTVARMLLDNADFYHYFLSLSRPSDPVRDPFRRLEQRICRVLRELDTHATTSPSSPEGPRNVAWAASHLTGVADLIRTTVFRRDRPAAPWERISACRALVRILASVVARNTDAHPGPTRSDRNLYARLIGDNPNGDFIIGTLLLLPDAAAQFLQDLEVISDAVGVNGAPGPFVEKLARLLQSLKKPAGGGEGVTRSSSKRQGRQTSGDRGSKRMK
ncbi:hypothetical protein F5X68DRAFT_260646 [Plectosphaerella plurivora]|uniref:SWIM-type domain-containing protein n=1 Tax=Plectosphaerella plurivora TaxID=936078 RepID=A0A9P8VD43_9PEZI|nr:hypothetical protein F5X68DRAFT_260646 [Plectosphaerella plurivora]